MKKRLKGKGGFTEGKSPGLLHYAEH